jgi:hypothetical protein
MLGCGTSTCTWNAMVRGSAQWFSARSGWKTDAANDRPIDRRHAQLTGQLAIHST